MRKWLAVTFVGVAAGAWLTSRSMASDLPTVASVDLSRYAGKWYEFARYPNRFERSCESDVTAEYALRPDGKISVVNSCRTKSGRWKIAKGIAKIADKSTNARLRVSFFRPFYGDYWIIALDDQYRWAVVGEPSRKYLWILSRTPELQPAVLAMIDDKIRAAGYDPSRLIRPKQARTPAA